MTLQNYTVIYGGSFSPPHFGHTIAAMWLVEALKADKVIIAPTFQHAFGKPLEKFDRRVVMCQYAFDDLRNVVVSMIEAEMPKPNKTLNLVKALKGDYNKLAVAIGADLVPQLNKFEGWDEVRSLAKIVVIGRDNIKVEATDDMFAYPIDLSAVSSSDIRERIKTGQDITGLVSWSVKEYMEKRGMYK